MKRKPKRARKMKKLSRIRAYRGMGSNGVHARFERKWHQLRSLYQ